MLGPFIGKMRLKLAAVMLVLLDEWLELVRDIVVIQKWPLKQPVWKMRHSGLDQFEGAVFVDVLAVCAQDEVLLDLAVLPEWRLKTDVIEWRHLILVCDVLHVVNRPLR